MPPLFHPHRFETADGGEDVFASARAMSFQALATAPPSSPRDARALPPLTATRGRRNIKTALGVSASAAAICCVLFAQPRVFQPQPVIAPPETASEFKALYEDSEAGVDGCGNSLMLNDFSSKRGMEEAGWEFRWTDEYAFKPSMYRLFAPSDSYWGFKNSGVGAVALGVKGSGTMTLDFGNLLGSEDSKVSVYRNTEWVGSAGPSELSKTIQFSFQSGNTITVAEDQQGIILLNRVGFKCVTTSTPPEKTTTAGTAEDETLKQAAEKFKKEHMRVEELHELERRKKEQADAAKQMKEAGEEMLKEDKEGDGHKPDPGPSHEENEENAKLAKALLGYIQAARKAEKDAKAQGEEKDTKVIAGLVSGKTGDDKNETLAKQMIEHAEKARQAVIKELQEAHRDSERQKNKSAAAAKELDLAIAMKREKDKERDRVAAMVSDKVTTTSPPLSERHSLYCFTLMLPFGYEPSLIAEQKKRKVGFFQCEEMTVFSNQTYFLDKEGHPPLPLDVVLLDFSLAVEYGGKWHTALNTPVFNRIWRKVVDMRLYMKHDWVVKADIDTVWFPDRLKVTLTKGIPEAVLAKPAARRLQANDNCKHCQLPSRHDGMCEDSVRWLQKHRNKTCDEALRLVARPPPVDCGCQCTDVEACDLSSQPDAWLDGHYKLGDLLTPTPAIYINNCRFGLHGPIEVFSSGAVTAYVEGLPQCEFLTAQPWGEDKYLDRCMMTIGVTRVNIFALLSEVACGEEPAPCDGPNVAFHPFKNKEDFFACWGFADSVGERPFETKAKSGKGDEHEQFV